MRIARHMSRSSISTLLVGAVALLFSASALSQFQVSPAERRMQLATGPDEFLFFEDDRKKVVDYKQERIVRVCVSDNRHLVPMVVIYDGERSEIHPGDCMRIEAKEVELFPAERLEANWVIRAEVETVS